MKFVGLIFCTALIGSVLSFHTQGKSPQTGLRIINGEEAVAHSIPWQAYLEMSDTPWRVYCTCGGVLITQNYVLTGARCLTDIGYYKLISAKVTLGAHNRSAAESTQQIFTSRVLIVHPGFGVNNQMHNDVGLIKLPQAATLTSAVKPIPLSSLAANLFYNKTATLSGWGYTNPYQWDGPAALRVTNVTVVDDTICDDIWYNYNATVQMCSQGPNNQGPCGGDGGGPLTYNGTLIGIASYAPSNCETTTNRPAVYTRLSYYIDWIKENSDYE